ncbi:methyltransferase domain-containing protein [Piscinibacter sp.]|uniref:methyltransferase domain-containing protein n=1 Tax=Piscinibacter sp. TaxID=1903157 RepID=UPI002CA58BB2|nr:methyltransferase domain-containing protein [Albitalea sp.]HUG21890.1 methyltransferase domain-containing protein [Albitalea sp.]
MPRADNRFRSRRERVQTEQEPCKWLDEALPREPTALHEARLDAVCGWIRAAGARSVADLGCGDGLLVRRLVDDARIERVVGVDVSLPSLGRLERDLPHACASRRVVLVHGSFTDRHPELAAVDCVAMVETIEHIALDRLSRLEHEVFDALRPLTVIVTTPNQEFNVLFGMAPGQMREPGHCFEWPRARFRAWAAGVALRHGYASTFSGIGDADPWRGCPTQAAVFSRPGHPPATQ